MDLQGLIQELMNSGMSREEIDKRLRDIMEETGVNLQGAATILSSEFDSIDPVAEKIGTPSGDIVSIADLKDGMKGSSLMGRVDRVGKLINFSKKGNDGRLLKLFLNDGSAENASDCTIIVNCWDNNASMVDDLGLSRNTPVLVTQVNTKKSPRGLETHMSSRSMIEILDNSDLPEISVQKNVKFCDLQDGYAEIVGRVVRATKPYIFDRKNGSQGRVSNIYIADRTGQIQINFWDDDAVLSDGFRPGLWVRVSNGRIRVLPKRMEIHYTPDLIIEEVEKPDKKEQILFSSPEQPSGSKNYEIDMVEFDEHLNFRLLDMRKSVKNVNIQGRIVRKFDANRVKARGKNVELIKMVFTDLDGTKGTIAAWQDEFQSIEHIRHVQETYVLLENVSIKKDEVYGYEILFKNSKIHYLKMENTVRLFGPREYGLSNIELDQKVRILGMIKEVISFTAHEACIKCMNRVRQHRCILHADAELYERYLLILLLEDGVDTLEILLSNRAIQKLLDLPMYHVRDFDFNEIVGRKLQVDGSSRYDHKNHDVFVDVMSAVFKDEKAEGGQ